VSFRKNLRFSSLICCRFDSNIKSQFLREIENCRGYNK
jgi:hypothetical protein